MRLRNHTPLVTSTNVCDCEIARKLFSCADFFSHNRIIWQSAEAGEIGEVGEKMPSRPIDALNSFLCLRTSSHM